MPIKTLSAALWCTLIAAQSFVLCGAQASYGYTPSRSTSGGFDPRAQYGFLEATALPNLKVFYPEAVAFIDVSTDRPNTRLEFVPGVNGVLTLMAIYEFPQDGQWPQSLGPRRTHTPVAVPMTPEMAARLLKVLHVEIEKAGKVANTGRDGLYYVFGVRQADGTFKMARVWSPNRYNPARLAEITDILLKLRFAYTDKETQARLALVDTLIVELETGKNEQ